MSEVDLWYRKKRLKEYRRKGHCVSCVLMHAFFHRMLLPLMIIDRKLNGYKVVIVKDLRTASKRRIIYCPTHIGGMDIQIAAELAKGPCNTALKEAIYMADLAHHVYLIHRRNEFRGSGYLVDELRNLPNATVLTPYVPVAILGDNKVTGAVIQNRETGEEKTLDVQGVFPLVGQIPNSQFINIDGVKDEWGTIPVNPKTKQTNVEGLYAGGDILPRDIRQIYLSEVDGKMACKAILEYLKK